MRKHLFYCLSTSCLVFSVASYAQISNLNGLYAGVQGDHTWQNINGTSRQLAFNAPLNSGIGNIPFFTNQNLFSGKLFIGQNYFNDNFVLGSELDASWYENSANTITMADVTSDLSISAFVTKINPKYAVSYSLLPGVKFNSSTFYGRIGGGFTKYNVYINSIVNTAVSPEVFSVGKYTNTWNPELILGLGYKVNFLNNIALRIEYNYKTSRTFSVASNAARSTASAAVLRAVDNSYRAKSNSLGLGLMYEFDQPVLVVSSK